MKKKILFVARSLSVGGAERVLVTVINGLVQRGYDVTLLQWRPESDFQKYLDPRVHIRYKAPDEHFGNRIPYIRYKFYDDCMWALRATPEQFHRYYVGREKYDVEIAFFHGITVNIVAGSTDNDTKRIVWIHNNLERLKTEKDIEKARALFQRFHHVVCVSEASRESFLRIIGDTGDVRVIYNPLSAAKIREMAQREPEFRVKKAGFHIVQAARYVEGKGYLRLIDAAVRLKKEGKDISLSLVGEGAEEVPIRKSIRDNHAEDYIYVISGRTNPFPYIKEADLLVCASYLEGYNLTVAEAMILGVPVLSTNCAGPRDILDGGRYGMLVENSDEGLYNGIKELYESPELLEHYRKKTAERLDFFDEDRIFDQITELIEG